MGVRFFYPRWVSFLYCVRFFFTGCVFSRLRVCSLPWVFPVGRRGKQKRSRKNKPPAEKKRPHRIEKKRARRKTRISTQGEQWVMGGGMKRGKKCSTSIKNGDLRRIETREASDIFTKKLNHLKFFLEKPLTSRPTAPTKSSFLMRVLTYYVITIPLGGFVFLHLGKRA